MIEFSEYSDVMLKKTQHVESEREICIRRFSEDVMSMKTQDVDDK